MFRITCASLMAAAFVFGAAGSPAPAAVPASASGKDKPSVFRSLSYEEALSTSKAEGKVLIVYATASWCPPCRLMAQTTWVDEKLIEWGEDRLIAIKFDVDENRELSQHLRVQAMPTTVAYRDGEEFDRIVGYRDTEGVIAWLEDVKAGRRAIDRLREKVEAGAASVRERMDFARELVGMGEYDDATSQYLWLWENMLEHDPHMVGVRGSFMVSEMQRLAAQHPPAREAFEELREEAGRAVMAGRASQSLMRDWMLLCEMLDDFDAVIKWFDTLDADEQIELEVPYSMARRLFPVLIKQGRWAEAGRLHRDPLLQVQHHPAAFLPAPGELDIPDEQIEEMRRSQEEEYRRTASELYAACLAARRLREAVNVARTFLDNDDTAEARVALVDAAIRAGQVREHQKRWLDEAAEMGYDVSEIRRRYDAAGG